MHRYSDSDWGSDYSSHGMNDGVENKGGGGCWLVEASEREMRSICLALLKEGCFMLPCDGVVAAYLENRMRSNIVGVGYICKRTTAR